MAPCSKVIGQKVVAYNYIEGAVTTTKPCQTSQPRDVSAGNKISPDTSNVLAWACLCRMPSRARFLAHGHRDSWPRRKQHGSIGSPMPCIKGRGSARENTADGIAAAHIASAARTKTQIGLLASVPHGG